MTTDHKLYNKTVMTLDAGGTNFVFSAMKSFENIIEPIRLPAMGDDLEKCLKNITEGFQQVKSLLKEAPEAISFAFPGPADYKKGIIGDLLNLRGFRGGIALGPMLEEIFGIPVFINNDGNLFAYGEAIAGFLPEVNKELKESGNSKQFRNLIGITLGTGFGAGITLNGNLLIGDNSNAGEVWLLRDFLNQNMNAEESISIRAIIREYFKAADLQNDAALTPEDIYHIAKGAREGDQQAALEAFHKLGLCLGEALANILTLIDGVVVIGGGISAAKELFMPSMMKTMNGNISNFEGQPNPRLVQKVYNFEDEEDKHAFLKGSEKNIKVPGSEKNITYEPLPRSCAGISKMGTSEAIAVGAFAYAVRNIS
jgi:glucokinase